VGKVIGAAALPTPLNTPSLRRESESGKDSTFLVVSAGAGSNVWGSAAASATEGKSDEALAPKPSASGAPSTKLAPWAKPSTSAVVEVAAESTVGVDIKGKAAKSWVDIDSDEEDKPAPPSNINYQSFDNRDMGGEDPQDRRQGQFGNNQQQPLQYRGGGGGYMGPNEGRWDDAPWVSRVTVLQDIIITIFE
jgi:hypothetical protein